MSPSDLVAIPDDVSQAWLLLGHRLGPFAGRLAWYSAVPSTNDVAGRLAERGAGEGSVVAADAQTAGRGRQGRTWESPAGAGIYASAILRPDSHMVPLLTIAAGVAIAEGVEAATGLEACVKWPNDIHIRSGSPPGAGGRKLAGILAEAGVSAAGQPHVILGFGINLLPAAYPPEVAARATSLESELGRPVNRGLLLAECLCALWVRYEELRQRRRSSVLSAWRGRAAATFGRRVEWEAGSGVREGTVEEIDDDGALVVRADHGTVRVTSGAVRWL